MGEGWKGTYREKSLSVKKLQRKTDKDAIEDCL